MAPPGLHINQLTDDLLLRILVDVLREADRTARWDIGCAATPPRVCRLELCEWQQPRWRAVSPVVTVV